MNSFITRTRNVLRVLGLQTHKLLTLGPKRHIYYAVSFNQSEGSILSLMELSKRPSYTKAILLEYNTLKGVKSYRAKEVSK